MKQEIIELLNTLTEDEITYLYEFINALFVNN